MFAAIDGTVSEAVPESADVDVVTSDAVAPAKLTFEVSLDVGAVTRTARF